MTLGLYQTTTILKAVQHLPKTHTFLRDTFFPTKNDETFPTEQVIVDYTKGKRKMAPFVAPRTGGVTMARDGFRTERYTAPRLAPQKSLSVDDVMHRMAGESVVSAKTPAQRSRELLAKDLIELHDMITRREEWLAAQTLINGRVIMKGYAGDSLQTIEEELDFGFTQNLTLTENWLIKDATGTELIPNPDANPYEDIKEWRRQIIKEAGVAPDVVLLGSDAEKGFVNNPHIIEMMDKKSMHFGNIEPSIKSDAVTFIGKLPGLGVEIYTYDDWYLDDDGVEYPYIPADKVLLAKKAFAGFAYGAITQMEQGSQEFKTYEGGRVPKVWADHQNEQKMIRLSSRPVPKPGNVDGWIVASVVEV